MYRRPSPVSARPTAGRCAKRPRWFSTRCAPPSTTRHEAGIVSFCRADEQEVGARLAQEWSELTALTFDQEARATPVWLPCGRIDLCPVTALEAWLAAAKITEGPLFRRIWRLPPPRVRRGMKDVR